MQEQQAPAAVARGPPPRGRPVLCRAEATKKLPPICVAGAPAAERASVSRHRPPRVRRPAPPGSRFAVTPSLIMHAVAEPIGPLRSGPSGPCLDCNRELERPAVICYVSGGLSLIGCGHSPMSDSA